MSLENNNLDAKYLVAAGGSNVLAEEVWPEEISGSDPSVAVKRGIDIVLGSLLLVLMLPVLLIAALAVRLTSRGPVIFRQRRIGQDAQVFDIYKFRTMWHGPEESEAEASDPNRVFYKDIRSCRVTRVGRVLRKLSIDELPQLINVVKGDMSLVGPRPLLQSDFRRYPRDSRMRRFDVKPGMTGLWQVSGRSLCTDEERIRLDLEYVDGWSVLLDLQILLRTPEAVLSTRGAF